MMDLTLKLLFLAVVALVGWQIAPVLQDLAGNLAADERIGWAALLPLVYVVGMLVLLKD